MGKNALAFFIAKIVDIFYRMFQNKIIFDVDHVGSITVGTRLLIFGGESC